MKIMKENEHTLVVSSRGWFRFALLVGLTLATPVFIWIVIQIRVWELLVLAAIGPVATAIAFWKDYENWQLVLERDFNRCAFYSGPWLRRQSPFYFQLEDVKEAFVHAEDVHYYDAKFNGSSVTEFHLALNLDNHHAPLLVGLGSEGDANHIVYYINRWLSKTRRGNQRDVIDSPRLRA